MHSVSSSSVTSVNSRKNSASSKLLLLFFVFLALITQPSTLHAATVTGNLVDLSLSPLNTKLLFSPTNTVLITEPGLSAGPPKVVTTTAGAFSVILDAGDYTVVLPLIPTRNPFRIAVPNTTATINITNLMNPPATYVYTTPPSGAHPPLQVNASQISIPSSAGESTLLDQACTIPANTLAARNVILIEAFGSFGDPDANGPPATLAVKLAGNVILTESKTVADGNWHLRAILTVRSSGASGTAAASLFLHPDNPSSAPFNCDTQTATIDTTTDLALDITASIENITGSETLTCEQLIITLL